jgi:hypothetical protein
MPDGSTSAQFRFCADKMDLTDFEDNSICGLGPTIIFEILGFSRLFANLNST